MKVTYSEAAIADIVDAITYLNERIRQLPRGSTRRSRAASSASQTSRHFASQLRFQFDSLIASRQVRRLVGF